MRIVVDLQACQNAGRHRGIGRYAMAMTKAMVRANRGHAFRIVVSTGFPGTIGAIRRELEGVLPQEQIVALALPGGASSGDRTNAWRTRAAEIVRTRFIDGLAPDLLFVPTLFEGFWDATVVSVEPTAYPTAVTVHDLIPLDHPDVYLPLAHGREAYLRKLRNLREAALLLPISDYVAREVIGRLAVPPERVVAIANGVDPMFRPVRLDDAARSQLMRRYGIGRPYVLNTSPFEYRKNLEGLIAGFAAMDPAMRGAHQLVVIGRMDDAQGRQLTALAARAGLAPDALVLAGFVPDEDLIALYGECRLFVFPSISEGFDLPVLEAMACGAPVVASSATSIPEVVGRDELLFDPRDPAAIAATMQRVLADPALRAELRAFGPDRAAVFTWERAAATALDAFERIVADRPAGPLPAAPPTEVRSGRPSLAFVAAAAMTPGADATARNLALVEAFAAFHEVTLICAGGAIEDAWTRSAVDVRDPGWFERAAPRFDHIVYSPDGGVDAWFDALAAAFPGVMIASPHGAGAAPIDACSLRRDVFAARGFPGLLDMADERLTAAELQAIAGAAARASALGSILVADGDLPARPGSYVVPAPELAARAGDDPRLSPPPRNPGTAVALRDAVADLRRPRSADPVRALAAALPTSVRDVLPDGIDLAQVAAAVAINEAHDRPPAMLLDLTALDGPAAGPLGDTARALLTAMLRRDGPAVRCVTARGGRWFAANALVGGLIGFDPGGLADEPWPVRPGDRLIAIDVLGGFPAAAAAAMRMASDAGAGLLYALLADTPAEGMSAAAAAALGHAERLPVSTISRLHADPASAPARPDSAPSSGVEAVAALLAAQFALDVALIAPDARLRRRLEEMAPALRPVVRA